MLRDVDDDVDNNKDEEKGERGRGQGTAQKGKRSIYLLAHKSKCCWMQMRRRNGASKREREIHIIQGTSPTPSIFRSALLNYGSYSQYPSVGSISFIFHIKPIVMLSLYSSFK